MSHPTNHNETTVLFGFHAVRSALRHEAENIDTVWINPQLPEQKRAPIEKLCAESGIPLKKAARKKLDSLTADSVNANHQGIVAELRQDQGGHYHESDLPGILATQNTPTIILALDGVTDPHNLGACLRTANAVGAACVITPKDNAAGLTPIVRKVASGAAEATPLIPVTNLARTLGQLKDQGFWVVGTSDQADQDLYQAELPGNCVLVMGAEGKGMRPNTQKHCDLLISIPMQGSVESLNVSVATGVCLYEWQRQTQ